MELLAVAIGIYFFFFPVYLGIKVSRLSTEVSDLKRMLGTTAKPSIPVAPVPQMLVPEVSQSTAPTAMYQPHVPVNASVIHEPTTHNSSFDLVEWVKQDFLVKLGAFLLLLAFGWFVSYAFANNWVGPVGRIMLGMLAGLAFMVVGIWRIRTEASQGSIFTVLGSTIVLLTVFAARELYEIFTPTSALAIMFLSVVFVAFVAVQYNRASLAVAGLVLGGIAPLLTNTPDPSTVGLFSYLLIVVLGSLWVMNRIGVVALPVISFAFVAFYGTPYLMGSLSDAESSIALLFAFIFTTIFFVSNIVSIIKRNDHEARQAHIILALGTGLYLVSWIAVAVDPVWHSLLYVAWALTFSFGSFFVYTHTNQKAPFYIYSAIAVGLIAAATAAELSGPLLVIAYTVQVTLLLGVISAVFKDYSLLSKSSWLYIVPIMLSGENIASSAWYDGFLHSDFFALFVLMLGCLIATVVILERRPSKEGDTVDAASVLGVIAGFYGVTLIWLVTHAVLFDQLATTLSLVIYMVCGLVFFISGRRMENNTLRKCGAVLIGMVVVRLLLIDVWEMPLAARIVTFFIIGIMLLSTAFINKSITSKK